VNGIKITLLEQAGKKKDALKKGPKTERAQLISRALSSNNQQF